ncbi:OmpA family protein [Portibacter marinus]|uniref:OmpA family protein n=1 Tax=Portibacter marinus TaxID=2898660 RepID=UPI001F22C1E4|nr:OmpA family protein [Portibacter marinus]
MIPNNQDHSPEPPKGGMMMKWMLPLVVLIGVAYYFSKTEGCSNVHTSSFDEQEIETGDSISSGADKIKAAVSTVFQKMDEGAKKALEGISFTANSAGANMLAYINGDITSDSTFIFTKLSFQTGSAAIESGSGEEVDNLASILKAYPGVNVEIQGHTDNIGDAAVNKALSQARAEAVKARLVDRGIDSNRLVAKGYGDEEPIATNETEEGRRENRRVQVKIRKGR